MDIFPIFLLLKNQPALVVGGEEGAENKLRLLLKAQAQITLIAVKLHPKVKALGAQHPEIEHQARSFTPDDLKYKKLVFIVSENEQEVETIFHQCQARQIPVNAVDQPQYCSFYMPSIVDRDPLVMAVSSSGSCPRLSRMVRAKLETLFPPAYSRLAQMMAEMREKTRALPGTVAQRKSFWDKIFASPLIDIFLSGQERQARRALEKEMRKPQGDLENYGQVALVGAGPGDPELLTLRALRLIQAADVLVYDRLVNPAILEFARREAARIYVGKEKSRHIIPQEQINQILVDLAKEGKLVVRLKGGDPFIFGRGGEEIERLLEFGVDFQVVPGVTAAAGCGAYAGIPLTHRDYAQSVRMITGHLKDDHLDLDWHNLAVENQTIVFYMGLSTAPLISRELLKQGMDPQMPIAVIEQGTLPNQQIHLTDLTGLPQLVAEKEIQPPALIILGRVVNLHSRLNWYDPEEANDMNSEF